MTRDDRIRALLAAIPGENALRLRSSAYAAEFLGESRTSLYRHVTAGELVAIKGPGKDRGKLGSAGRLKFRLLDLLAFQVDRELTIGPAGAPEAASTSSSRVTSMAGRRAGGARG